MKSITIATCLLYSFVFANAAAIAKGPKASKSRNYLIQLDPKTNIDDFIPQLLEGTLELVDKNEVSAQGSPVAVTKKFDINDSFKALKVKINNDSILAKVLAQFPEIATIIPDDPIKFNLPKPQSIKKVDKFLPFDIISAQGSQSAAPWNLVRVSQHTLNFSSPYYYPDHAGEGVVVYVIDDGVNKGHVDFGGRVTWGYSTINDGDNNGGGHGTHVSGIIAGNTYGVAKKAQIVSVRVLDKSGSGSMTDVLDGLQWAVQHSKTTGKRSLVNMSLGVRKSSGLASFDDAITAAVNGGLPIVVAAGNSADNACNYLPAGNLRAYTVGSIDNADKLSYFSSYGTCVDINAPGSNIKSDYIGSTTATTIMSGTSMASPHVAGVAALLIHDLADPTPDNLYNKLTSIATKDKITNNKSGNPNLIAYNGAGTA
ncbi:peptidase S8/S53 domain-containing protein [Cunninghamella echinulata]|nr:peptidase S8/S53 domain-containing protein [Cunninghamella echinulata]